MEWAASEFTPRETGLFAPPSHTEGPSYISCEDDRCYARLQALHFALRDSLAWLRVQDEMVALISRFVSSLPYPHCARNMPRSGVVHATSPRWVALGPTVGKMERGF